METLVALSNIGAFVVQFASLGQAVTSNTRRIQSILEDAHQDVVDATDLVIDVQYLMTKDMSKKLYDLCDGIRFNIEQQLEMEATRTGFLISAKRYKTALANAKAEAKAAKAAKSKIKTTTQSLQRAENDSREGHSAVPIQPLADDTHSG
ncbi:hypothetical protein Hypma_007496 [Hypsizygus marmoreus]|uniref:Fungal N-terminal domain-containing protein n=1 Tax=Hypsizygus marmoreus TaxID=39966 RepID=A0A369JVT7_HYPMA|nr:hypothetical protein Hypma_007496 [Hypsizygus marmoreus]